MSDRSAESGAAYVRNVAALLKVSIWSTAGAHFDETVA
jgi:hypothetical protein